MDDDHDDLIWRALSSPHRRAMLDLLRQKPHTTGMLADALPDIGRCAVMQHLGVLVEASLVLVHREGRERWNSLNVVPLQQAFERWVTPFQSLWASRLQAIKAQAEAIASSPKPPTPRRKKRK